MLLGCNKDIRFSNGLKKKNDLEFELKVYKMHIIYTGLSHLVHKAQGKF